jgi:hypothetical protein
MFMSALFTESAAEAGPQRNRGNITIRRQLRTAARAWERIARTPPSTGYRELIRTLARPDARLLGLVSMVKQDTLADGAPAAAADLGDFAIFSSIATGLDGGSGAVQQRLKRRALAFSRLQTAVQCLNDIGDSKPFARRYVVNVNIINAIFMEIVPLFVGEDLYSEFIQEIHEQWLMRPAVQRRVNVWTSRQAGKTTALAICMAVALNCSYHTMTDLISCYSRSETQAMGLLRMVVTAYSNIPLTYRRHLVAEAAKHLIVRRDDGSLVMVKIHSSSVATNRGDNAAWIICDEFCFISWDLFISHLQPVERVAHRFVTYTTTPGLPSEPVTAQFMDWFKYPERYKDRLTLNFGLVCAQCTIDNCPLECRHRLHYMPPWTNAPMMMRELTYTTGKSRQTVMTELLGLPMESTRAVFTATHLLPLFRGTPHRLTTIDNRAIYIMIDPATAAERSNMAMITFCFSNRVLIILGMEDTTTYRTCEAEWHHLMLAHMRGLMDAYGPIMQNVEFVPMIEMNNNSGCSNGLCRALVRSQLRPVRDIYRQVNRDYIEYSEGGILTTAPNKLAGCSELLIRLNNYSIAFGDNLYSTGITEYQVRQMPTPEEQAHRIATEMSAAEIPVTPIYGPDSVGRVRQILMEQLLRVAEDVKGGISGKGTSKNTIMKDDLAICLIVGTFMAVFGRNLFDGLV